MPDENKKTRLQKMVNRLRNRLFNQRSTLEQLEREINRFLKRTKSYDKNRSKRDQNTIELDLNELTSLGTGLKRLAKSQFNSQNELTSLGTGLNLTKSQYNPQNEQTTGGNPNYNQVTNKRESIQLNPDQLNLIQALANKINERKKKIESCSNENNQDTRDIKRKTDTLQSRFNLSKLSKSSKKSQHTPHNSISGNPQNHKLQHYTVNHNISGTSASRPPPRTTKKRSSPKPKF